MDQYRYGRHGRKDQKRKVPGFRLLLAGTAIAVCLLAVFGISNCWGLISALAQEQEGVSPTVRVDVPLEEQGSSSGEAPWYLRLVNPDTPLPEDFTVELTDVAGGQFDSRAADALSRMLDHMEEQGLSPLVCSSFRTWEDQKTLHQNEIELWISQGLSQEEAEEEASRWVVPAGTSEHQTGLAADIVAAGNQVLEEEQENTPEQQWLMEHCWEYGFILRYPKDKTDLTGVGYEPWHYRYVGVEAAQEMKESGQCLEEYWAVHFTKNAP